MEEDLDERIEQVATSDQMLDSCGREAMEMGFTSMDSTHIFSPLYLTHNAFQGFTHEHIHKEVTLISCNGEKCSLLEEPIVFSFRGSL